MAAEIPMVRAVLAVAEVPRVAYPLEPCLATCLAVDAVQTAQSGGVPVVHVAADSGCWGRLVTQIGLIPV